MLWMQVFVTGGCGGVHHGDAMDISADLTELSRTPVALVCAGIKSILDIPRSLEYLETMGVPVVTVGQPNFPVRDGITRGHVCDFSDAGLFLARFWCSFTEYHSSTRRPSRNSIDPSGAPFTATAARNGACGATTTGARLGSSDRAIHCCSPQGS